MHLIAQALDLTRGRLAGGIAQNPRLAGLKELLSNVDRQSFAASNRKLGVDFDAIYTAQNIGSYKPDRRNFDYLLARLGDLGYAKCDVLHVAQSLLHDHAPAKSVIRTRFPWTQNWLNRSVQGGPEHDR